MGEIYYGNAVYSCPLTGGNVDKNKCNNCENEECQFIAPITNDEFSLTWLYLALEILKKLRDQGNND